MRLQRLEAQGPSEIDRAFGAMTRERAGALLVLLDSMLVVQRERIADLAAKSLSFAKTSAGGKSLICRR